MRNHIFAKKDAGFSVLETAIAMGLLGLMMAIGLNSVTRTQEMRILVEDRDVISQIEEEIRRAVHSNDAMISTARRSQTFDNCLRGNDQACPQGQIPLEIWMNSQRQVTGGYHGDGSPCEGAACLIRVNASFQGICGNTRNCDRARYILVRYQITADYHLVRSGRSNQGVLRSGILRRSFERLTDSDDNLACDLDEFSRTQFVNQVRPSRLNCVDGPRLNRQVQGVQTGDCRPDQELLVGFDGNGAPICEETMLSGRSR